MKTHSDQINEIAEAMVNAQKAALPAVKGSVNPFFKKNYADLESVWHACKDALHENGVAVIQGGATIDGKPHMETKLIHKSGQWLTSYWLMTPVKDDPQAMGSAITYFRRYSLASMVGVVTEDDDGNAASKGKPKAEAKKPKPEPEPEKKAEGPSFWDRDTYQLTADARLDQWTPDKWGKWAAQLGRAVKNCPLELDKLTKLQVDNTNHINAFADVDEEAHKAIMDAFADKARMLSQEPVK